MLNKLKHIFSDQFREPLPDFFRGAAILFMIQVHLTELILAVKPEYKLYNAISYFLGGIPAAPVFIILMGYFLDRSKSSLKQEIKRGFGIIVLGLLLNVFLNLSLIYEYIVNQKEVNILGYIFGIDILIFAGFSYLILSLLKRVIKGDVQLLFLIILIYVLQYLLQQVKVENETIIYLLSILYRNAEWSYFPLIPWLAYSVLGMFLHRTGLLTKLLEKRISNGIIFIYLILFFILINYGIEESQNLERYYNHNFIFFLYSIFVLSGFFKFLSVIYEKFADNILIAYIQWLGKNVTTVYIFQWIIIGNIATYLYKILLLQDTFIIFLLIMFSVSICTYLYNLSRT